MSARLHWLWLAAREPFTPRRRAALLAFFGSAERVYAAGRDALGAVPGLTEPQLDALCDKGLDGAARVSDACARLGVSVLTIADTGYPDRLRQIPDPPLVLYVRGALPDLDAQPGFAVVGTRKPSPYGLAAAARMAGALAGAGFVIVSGMAMGIDGEAARAALQAGGRTVAVLGGGVDICYPPCHRALMGDILLAGAVVSAYPPGTQMLPRHFPERNRIISGLSVGTLVIEAPPRSGSLITARCARDQGRGVFAVPGNIDAPSFGGSNRLLADGGAALAAEPDDIIKEYTGLLRGAPRKAPAPRVEPPNEGRRPEAPEQAARRVEAVAEPPVEAPPDHVSRARFNDLERAVIRAVQGGADTVDAVIDAVGQPTARVTACITMLELDGVLSRRGGRLCAEAPAR